MAEPEKDNRASGRERRQKQMTEAERLEQEIKRLSNRSTPWPKITGKSAKGQSRKKGH